MQTVDITMNREGEMVIHRERGDQIILTNEMMEAIWEEIEFRKAVENLRESEEIKKDQTLLEDIERLAEYYLAEKDELIRGNDRMLIRLSITDVDLEYEEELDNEESDELDSLAEEIMRKALE